MKNKTVILILSVLAVALYTTAVINFCLGNVLIAPQVLSPLWPLGLWTLATNGTQEGGGYKAGVEMRLAA